VKTLTPDPPYVGTFLPGQPPGHNASSDNTVLFSHIPSPHPRIHPVYPIATLKSTAFCRNLSGIALLVFTPLKLFAHIAPNVIPQNNTNNDITGKNMGKKFGNLWYKDFGWYRFTNPVAVFAVLNSWRSVSVVDISTGRAASIPQRIVFTMMVQRRMVER
jgi:hypothetical protein